METDGQGEGVDGSSTEEKVDDKCVTPVNTEVRLLHATSLVLALLHISLASLTALSPQPPARCKYCRQYLDDPTLKIHPGDPDDAVSTHTHCTLLLSICLCVLLDHQLSIVHW